MPDLNTESTDVRGQIASCMNTLLTLGIDGFRIDAAKHQAASSPQAIVATVKAAHPTTKLGESIWITQEIIPDGEVVRSDYVHGLKNAAGTACASDSVTVDTNGNATITVAADGGTTVPAVAIYTGQLITP